MNAMDLADSASEETHSDLFNVDQRWLRWETLLLVLLVAAGFVLRLWGMSKMHFWDENVYLQDAKVMCCGKTNYSELNSRPPLLSVLYAGVFLVWNHVYGALIVTALLNALAAMWAYMSGRMIAGRVAAAMTAFLFTFAPFLVSASGAEPLFPSDDTGHSLLADCPALSLILLSFWLLLRALKRQTDLRFGVAGFSLAMCVLMRFGSLSSVGIMGLLVLAADRRVRAIVACGVGFAIGFVPYLCWSRWRYGGFLTTLRTGWQNFEGPRESPFYYLTNYGHIFGWFSLVGLVLWIGRWAWMGRVRKASDEALSTKERAKVVSSQRLQGFLWLWGVVVLVFFSSIRHQEPRYILPLAAPLFLLSGIGLSVLLKGQQTAARIAGLVVLAGGMIYTIWPLGQIVSTSFIDNSVSAEMRASEYLDNSLAAGTPLYLNFGVPDFAYYTNLPIHLVPDGGDDLRKALETLPDGCMFVAYTQYDGDAPADPPVKWLDANPHFERYKQFDRIVIYRFHAGSAR
jgi:4-amino-4-deoxy-L-arabinose transferase-like glycosyltransferase